MVQRVPDEFELTDKLLSWTKLKCPLVNAREFEEEFRDIEFYRPHTDWPATWRNLCRKRQRELARYQRGPMVNVDASKRMSEAMFAEIDEWDRQKRERLENERKRARLQVRTNLTVVK